MVLNSADCWVKSNPKSKSNLEPQRCSPAAAHLPPWTPRIQPPDWMMWQRQFAAAL
jgi:hypothetical protein